LLGSGSFGKVFRLACPSNATAPSGQVLKMMCKKPMTNFHGIASLKRQVRMISLLSSQACEHPNIIKFYEVYHSLSHIMFRMEDGGTDNLFNRLDGTRGSLSVEQVESLLTQCVDGLHHLHTKVEMAHRDVKPENIMIDDTDHGIMVKYVDFDVSKKVHVGSTCAGTIGTFPFMGPEVLLESEYKPYPADIWSLGIVFLEVLCQLSILRKALSLPRTCRYASRVQKQQMDKHNMELISAYFSDAENVEKLLQEYIRTDLTRLMPDTQTMLKGMLSVVVEERWAAPQLLDALMPQFGPELELSTAG